MTATPALRERALPVGRGAVGSSWRRRSGGWPGLAAEGAPGYDAESPRAPGNSDTPDASDTPDSSQAPQADSAGGPRSVLAAAVEQLLAGSVDELDEPDISAELEAIEQATRQLDARRCRLVSELASRRSARARERAAAGGQDRTRAGQRARNDLQRELSETHQWSQTDAKRAMEVGSQLGTDEQAQEAFDAGQLSPRHARLLAETLKDLDGEGREEASRTLVAAAAEQDAHTFGRTCRRLLAELDGEAAMRGENRRYARRRASVSTTEDGMLNLFGQWSGQDAEILATAVDAFRTPDAPGMHRRPQQRTADAIIDMARAALRAGEAPTVHGVRPHVSVTIDYQMILDDTAAVEQGERAAPGVVEAPWVGPLPYAEIRRLLADAGVSRLLVDAANIPVEAGEDVRTVPIGLWRSLVARDGGCIAEGCDVPAAWCDVMHLERPFHLGGRLTLDTSGLGCRYHHREFDLNGGKVEWHDRRPILRPPT